MKTKHTAGIAAFAAIFAVSAASAATGAAAASVGASQVADGIAAVNQTSREADAALVRSRDARKAEIEARANEIFERLGGERTAVAAAAKAKAETAEKAVAAAKESLDSARAAAKSAGTKEERAAASEREKEARRVVKLAEKEADAARSALADAEREVSRARRDAQKAAEKAFRDAEKEARRAAKAAAAEAEAAEAAAYPLAAGGEWLPKAVPEAWREAQKSTNGIEKAAEVLEDAARNAGYYLARVKVEDGNLVAVPGSFGAIGVSFKSGDTNSAEGRFFSAAQLRRQLARSGVAEGEPFNYARLYEAFKDVNSNPDLLANVRLVSPVEKDGARSLAVNLEAEEENPLHFVGSIDNYGTGPDDGDYAADKWMARGTVQYLNLWKANHAVTASALTSLDNTLWGGAASYYAPFEIGRHDSSVTVHGGFTEVDSDDVVPGIDVEGAGWFAGVQTSVELFPDWNDSLRLALGLTWRNVWDRLLVAEADQKEKLNKNEIDLLPLSVALMYSSGSLDGWMGRNYATLEVVRNVGGSNADEIKKQRFAAEDDYTIVRAQLARIQTLGGKGSYAGRDILFGKVDAQWSDGALVSAEQMGVGGASSVRGYKEREWLGDHAVTASLEWRTPLLLGYLGGSTEGETPRDRLQLVVFGDMGWIGVEDALAGEDDSQVLGSVGAGLRFAWGEHALMRFDWGFPLKETSESDHSGRGHVSLSAQF